MLTDGERAWLLRAARRREQERHAAEDLASCLETESGVLSAPRRHGSSTREQEAFWARVEKPAGAVLAFRQREA